MRCLTGGGTTIDQIHAQAEQIDRSGAAFVWVGSWGEWMVVTRDVTVKRALVRRYGRGLQIWTLAELPIAADPFAREMCAMFGAEVE